MNHKPKYVRPGNKDIFFVAIQFFFFGAYLLEYGFWEFELPIYVSVIFLLLAIFGVALGLMAVIQLNTNLSPFPTPRKGSQLIENGVFKFVRHPIYSGIFLTLFGYGVFAASAYKIIIAFVLLGIFYFKSDYEEERLLEAFPNYKEYRKITGRFFPKI